MIKMLIPRMEKLNARVAKLVKRKGLKILHIRNIAGSNPALRTRELAVAALVVKW